MQLTLDGGFAEPVFCAQHAFRAIMNALASPGCPQRLGANLRAPRGLPPGLAFVALTLCDHDTPVWLSPALRDNETIKAWLGFQTGAPVINDPALAHFALVADPAGLPALDRFAQGSAEYPDRSTTIAVEVPALHGGRRLALRGPGIPGCTVVSPAGLPTDFFEQWSANRGRFPRGVDLLLVCGEDVLGLPRSTRINLDAS